MEKEIRELLKSNSEDIRKAVNDSLKRRVVEALDWSIRESVSGAVEEYTKEHILPALVVDLQAATPDILAALHAGIVSAAVALGEQMKERVNANVSGYSFRKAMEELFK